MLEIKGLGKTYGIGEKATEAIGDVSFTVADGEFVCVVGPSGCGKTTLLKCIAGLLPPSHGEVMLAGREGHLPARGDGARVPGVQPVAVPVDVRARQRAASSAAQGVAEERRAGRLVEDALDEMGLATFMDHYPWQLSGGMQQRVAIARALAYQPSILLMDEPFASVDAQTRDDLEDLVLSVREHHGVTILFVTHDIDESVYLADRIVVLTHAPTHVKEIVAVELREKRDQIETKELPEFAQLRTHVYRLIKREQSAADEAEVTWPARPLLPTEVAIPAAHADNRGG